MKIPRCKTTHADQLSSKVSWLGQLLLELRATQKGNGLTDGRKEGQTDGQG
jgi:hypothetical protein